MAWEHLTNNFEKFRNAVIDTNAVIQELEESLQGGRTYSVYKHEIYTQSELNEKFYAAQEKLNDLYRGKY